MSRDSNMCKVCGKMVRYWSVPKANGKTRFYAFHEGDATIPPGSIEFAPDKISGIHKMRRRKELEEVCAKTAASSDSSISEEVETEVVSVQAVPANIVPVAVVKKEKVVMLPQEKEEVQATVELDSKTPEPEVILTEVHEVPSISAGKPIVDITKLNRNRFAIIGAIRQKLTEGGLPNAMEVNSLLIAKGKDLPSLLTVAAPYVQIFENDKPLSFI